MVARHRSGPLRQENKPHKSGRHRTNREVDKANNGKINLKLVKIKAKHELKKREKRNKLLQIRKRKREEVVNDKRKIGFGESPPLLITILNNGNAHFEEMLECIKECGQDIQIDERGIFVIKFLF
jgi:pre-rRNA-processing protein TSR1 homolog